MLVNRVSLHRHAILKHCDRPFHSRRTIDDEELRPAETTPDEVIEDSAPSFGVLAALFLTARRIFCPSARTPITTRSEIEVALPSRRTRTAVPSRISRTVGSSA